MLIQARALQSFPALENRCLYENPVVCPTPQRFPPSEAPSSGVEINTERSRLHTNWHLTRSMYNYSLILRRFRAEPKLIEDDASGFMKALLY